MRVIRVVLSCIAILVFISWLAPQASIADETDLSGYSYVKSHTIQGRENSTLSDNPIMLIVHRGMGTDSGRNVYLDQRPLSWPDDIRFTDSAGNPLDYRVESSDTGKVVVWVKLDRIPRSFGMTNIRLYYGKAGDYSASNGSIVIGSDTANEPIHQGWGAEVAVSESKPLIKPTAIGVNTTAQAGPAQQPATTPSEFLSPTVLLLGLGALMAIGAVLVTLLIIFVLVDLLKNASGRR